MILQDAGTAAGALGGLILLIIFGGGGLLLALLPYYWLSNIKANTQATAAVAREISAKLDAANHNLYVLGKAAEQWSRQAELGRLAGG